MIAEVTNSQKIEDYVKQYIADNSGLKMRTGNLKNSTSVKTVRTRSGAVVKISNSAKYAAAQDQGSGLYGRRRAKYIIRGNPTLRFVWKGQVVYRRYVMHPGVKQTRFLYNATDAAGRVAAFWLSARMKDVARKF